jgi:hypothetical protein
MELDAFQWVVCNLLQPSDAQTGMMTQDDPDHAELRTQASSSSACIRL